MNGKRIKETDLPTGDAFLVYLRIYVKDALDLRSFGLISKRITRIKKELMTEHSSERVEIVENAEEALKAGSD